MASTNPDDGKASPPGSGHEKFEVTQLEQVATHENTPGKGHYIEENGLRTEGSLREYHSMAASLLTLLAGDGVDHHDGPVRTSASA